MSRFARACITRGTRRSGVTSTCCIENHVEGRTFMSANAPTDRGSSSRRGCSTAQGAERCPSLLDPARTCRRFANCVRFSMR
jgi:hypothetical protein